MAKAAWSRREWQYRLELPKLCYRVLWLVADEDRVFHTLHDENKKYHVMPLARISLTLSRHFTLSFIASGRSSELHPVSSQSCCMYVRTGHPALAQPYVGVHWSTSLMSSSLLLQQCPACLVRLTWIVYISCISFITCIAHNRD